MCNWCMTNAGVMKWLLLMSWLFSSVSYADVPPGQVAEVQHLLAFVAGSNCKLERNGSLHDGKEAVAHIKKKYDYFRDEINTTEDFIAYSATKSTLSGRRYHVQCPGKAVLESRDWLLNELHRYRTAEARQKQSPGER